MALPTDIYNNYYPGWGQVEAEADWEKYGKYKYGGGSEADGILSNAINSVTSYVNKITPYSEKNPFSFDEALAERAASEEYSPYYNELLSDYVAQVEKTKSRSQEDLEKTLEILSAGKEYYLGAERRALDKAIKNTNKGFAGNGLFFSGARKRDIQEMEEENKIQTNKYMQDYRYDVSGAQTTYKRGVEDVDWAEKQYTRDIEREKKYAVKSGVLQRKQEVKDEYEVGRQKYYEDQFGSYV